MCSPNVRCSIARMPAGARSDRRSASTKAVGAQRREAPGQFRAAQPLFTATSASSTWSAFPASIPAANPCGDDHAEKVVEVVGDAAGQLAMPSILSAWRSWFSIVRRSARPPPPAARVRSPARAEQLALRHEIVSPCAHSLDRDLFADGSRDDDERHVHVTILTNQAPPAR